MESWIKNCNKRSGLPKVTLPPLQFHDYHIAPETTTLLNNGYTVQMIPKAFKYDFIHEFQIWWTHCHHCKSNKFGHQVALPKLSTNGFHKKKFILLSIRFSHLRILIILHRPSVTPRLSGGGLKHKYRQESTLEISFEVIEGGKVSFCMLTCFHFWRTPV